MSDIASGDLIRVLIKGRLDDAIYRLWKVRLAEYKGKDTSKDIADIKKEIDSLFDEWNASKECIECGGCGMIYFENSPPEPCEACIKASEEGENE